MTLKREPASWRGIRKVGKRGRKGFFERKQKTEEEGNKKERDASATKNSVFDTRSQLFGNCHSKKDFYCLGNGTGRDRRGSHEEGRAGGGSRRTFPSTLQSQFQQPTYVYKPSKPWDLVLGRLPPKGRTKIQNMGGVGSLTAMSSKHIKVDTMLAKKG